jgi:hypothetical protein
VADTRGALESNRIAYVINDMMKVIEGGEGQPVTLFKKVDGHERRASVRSLDRLLLGLIIVIAGLFYWYFVY